MSKPTVAGLIALFALALAIPTPGSVHAAEAATITSPTASASARIPYDPAIRRGVLANGLRYAVMRSVRPQGGISIRLGVDVGSFDEAEDERGIAHFIEHMAFRSTRAFPDNSVDGAFAGKGVAFGRDLNAGTDLLSTRFQLDLPTTNASDVALGLTWLRNVADGVVFDEAGLDKERGVVLAEKEARSNPQATAEQAVMRFQAPTLRSTLRDPIGDEQILKATTPQLLRAFYGRWYRPDNAVVVIVGDLPLDDLEAKVRATFDSWRAVGPPPTRAARGSPDPARGLDVFVFPHSALLNAVSICRLGPSKPAADRTVADTRATALGDIWRDVLNQRMSALRSDQANRLLGAEVETEDNRADVRSTCLRALPIGDAWAQPMRAADQELRRFASAGPTPLEVETAVERIRSNLRGAIKDAPNQAPETLAATIVEHELNGQVTSEAREALKAFDLAVEDLTVSDVRDAFARDWRGAGPLISVVSPAPPTVEELRSAWSAVESGKPLPAYADLEPLTWGYDFGEPGVVESRQFVALGQFVQIRFQNGVRLNFKKTDFEKDSVQLVIAMGDGRKELANQDRLEATVAGTILPLGGTGKHSFDDIHRIFPNGLVRFQVSIGDDEFWTSANRLQSNLPDDLNILAAYVSDPGFRPEINPIIKEAVNITYRLVQTSPQGAAQMALTQEIAPGSPATLPPRAAFDRLDNQRVSTILKPILTQDPIDVTLVGDIDEETAVRLVAKTFGALPPRKSPRPRRPDTFYLRFPDRRPATIRVTHAGSPDKAAVVAVWPLYVATASRRREEYSIKLLAAIFNDELRKRVRVDLGKSYAPEVAAHTPDDADQGDLSASVESYPGDIDTMVAEMRKIAEHLRSGQITLDELEAARAPMLASNRKALSTNALWAGAIERSSIDVQNLKDVVGFSDAISAIDLNDVKKAAADWLAQDPFVAIAEPSSPGVAAKP